jgi:lysylphosphatidylglycerol synthetase-like protein (DUF2156 family)
MHLPTDQRGSASVPDPAEPAGGLGPRGTGVGRAGFLSGVVLLFSGATPEIDSRLENIGFLIPHRLIDASHFGASLIGVLCLLLAPGLRRRLGAAWMLTMVLLLVGALLSLLKGFDWEEASLMTTTAVLLAIFRRSFYRRQPPDRVAVRACICGQRLRGSVRRSGCCVCLSGCAL